MIYRCISSVKKEYELYKIVIIIGNDLSFFFIIRDSPDAATADNNFDFDFVESSTTLRICFLTYTYMSQDIITLSTATVHLLF